ncbi:hypothetical protein ACO1D2_07945 [Bacillus thuringiensis]|uniref:hypothetical protein n=1 Tax=Bacillus thuringiensis TaxID=1428 RepID=UPI003BF7143C
MNYYQVNVNYLEEGWEFTTEQCFPIEGKPMLAQQVFKKKTKQYLDELVNESALDVEVLSVKTRRVTKKYYEQNKQLKVLPVE